MFLGVGSAATGIADLTIEAFIAAGHSRDQAARRLSFVDRHGLLVASRADLAEHKLPYVHEGMEMGFIEALRSIRPHVLIGATGTPGTFTREVIETMAEINDRPVIFALSNPTSRAECTAEQAYAWSAGRTIFASGSPFEPVDFEGRRHRPGQGNNAYIFSRDRARYDRFPIGPRIGADVPGRCAGSRRAGDRSAPRRGCRLPSAV